MNNQHHSAHTQMHARADSLIDSGSPGAGSGAIDIRRAGNGMTVVCETMAGVRSAGLSMLIPAGSAHDPESTLGMSAVVSETLLRDAAGQTSREMAEAFERLGVSRGCDSGTRYMHVSASMVGERLPEALELIAGMITRPTCTEAGVAASKELAIQSIRGLDDDPQQRAAYAARERHYPAPYHHSGLGTEAGIATITPDTARAWWHRHAVPEGTIIGIAGAVDPDHINDLLARVFDGWSGGSSPLVPSGSAPRGYAHTLDASNQVQVIVLHDGPLVTSNDRNEERVASAVLSGGMSGRLFTEVREKRGLCYSVSASYRPEPEFGTVSAYVGTTPERAQEALDVLVAELVRINAGDVSSEEFERALLGLKSRVIFSGESTASRAASIALDTYRLGSPRTLDQIAAEIEGVTLDSLNAYLKRRAVGELTIQTLGPAPLVPPTP